MFISRYFEAAICYLKAEQWQKAHNVLVNYLLSDLILKKGISSRNYFIYNFFIRKFFQIVDGKKTLKLLLSWLIDGYTTNGTISTIIQDSLTILEYLKLNENLINNKMSTEKLVAYIVSLCERIACFSENTVEER